jgi:hypothetical protein
MMVILGKKPKTMKDEKAFPAGTETELTQVVKNGQNPEGMNKRFYAACKAMQGILATASQQTNEQVVMRAYRIADEMLKQEES